MKVYKYKDYQHYLEKQIQTNLEKELWVYVNESVIKKIITYRPKATNVLCHGTRSAAEQKYFKRGLPNAYVIGTEISTSATKYPMTVRWDFTLEKEEWINKFDIVYSNSFDHTINPTETIKTWRNQLNESGLLFLEYAEKQSIGNDADPLDATENEIRDLINQSGLKIISQFRDHVKHGGIVFVASKC